MWDDLNNNCGGSNGVTEPYIIEHYHNYKMIDEKGVVE
jgi:hypothetical protein